MEEVSYDLVHSGPPYGTPNIDTCRKTANGA